MQELQLARGAWLLDAVTHHSVTREGTQGDLAKLTAQKDDVLDPCDSAVLAQALGYTLLRLALMSEAGDAAESSDRCDSAVWAQALGYTLLRLAFMSQVGDAANPRGARVRVELPQAQRA